MRPGEVLDAQADLIDRLDTDTFRKYVQSWGEAEVTAHSTRDAKAPHLPALLKRHVQASYAYRVTHDMTDLVMYSASLLEGTDQFDPQLAPTGCGIVCFDKPLPVIDARGRTMLIHWLVWGPAETATQYRRETATAFWSFNDIWRQPDEVAELFKAEAEKKYTAEQRDFYNHAMGRWASVGLEMGFKGQRIGPTSLVPSEKHAEQIIAEGDFPAQAGTNVMRYFHALWLMFNQTITAVEEEHPDRHARKRAVRKGLPPKVSVIRLRRVESKNRPEGESLVEWQHKWIVRGHWRWQPYGSRKADHVHAFGPSEAENGTMVQFCMHHGCENRLERIWVNPYVKGPEDAPLKQSEKVYSLER